MIKLRKHWMGVNRSYAKRILDREKATLGEKKKLLANQREAQALAVQRLQLEADELNKRLDLTYARIEDLRTAQEAAPAIEELLAGPEQAPSAEPPAMRLGDQLVRDGLISDAQLKAAMDSQKSHGGRLGDILIDMGFITDLQMKPIFRKQPRKGKLGDLLMEAGLITSEQLDKALAFQNKSGGLLGDILLSLQLIEPETLYRAIATQNNIGRIGNELSINTPVRLPETLARSYEVIVIHQYMNRFLVAVSGPLTEEQSEEVQRLLGLPVEQVLATKNEMERFWKEVYGSEMLHESTSKLADEQPHNSAITTFTRFQIGGFILIGLVIVIGLILNFWMTLLTLNLIVQLFYFTMSIFKFTVIMFGSRRSSQFRFTPEEIDAIDERELPVYTILVPMYRESQVLPHLLRNLEQLDYPKAKLDVRLLIEEDDEEMRTILQDMKLPAYYTVLVVPDGLPKTKPKACNYGLLRARGEYVVIFDAEDQPDPDQLKKVFLTFRQCPDNYACIQAKLNYFNSDQNLLTRWFTQEYSMWFELLLPGIMQLDVPIPLGGTSNHFKMSVLKELGAWDPFNVTEDADLGIRLYKHGYKTAIVDSRTWEEANSRTGNWIRQRSRWIKGYMQTWLVHMRNPFKLLREIGFKGFIGFQVMILATPMLPLLNPIFWLMLLLWFGWELSIIGDFFPGFIYYLASIEFYIGNFMFVFSNVAGVYWVIHELEDNRNRVFSYKLVRYALLTPLYWVLMSIAALKAAWQLVTNPFYWEKTEHGLTEPPTASGTDKFIDSAG
ncbi:glycosyltransferase family 2 protein [Paenibacillus nasutitermitis]|uniref:Glycosyl transferase n=1 Tax=Paenibacillus nasutitermitis TaxID=1652958 RepID=A0A917E1Y9_9BACL|nr:glycosyltransferase family 2 protein [Paenibacillus nasutitermitis]GGD94484.1 glycosyl transferase [Paenibacillus nasutitermitis]